MYRVTEKSFGPVVVAMTLAGVAVAIPPDADGYKVDLS